LFFLYEKKLATGNKKMRAGAWARAKELAHSKFSPKKSSRPQQRGASTEPGERAEDAVQALKSATSRV